MKIGVSRLLSLAIGLVVLMARVGYSDSVSQRQTAHSGGAPAASSQRGNGAAHSSASPAERAIEDAVKGGKHAFVLFYRPAASEDRKMARTFARAEANMRARAMFVQVDIGSRVESRLIDKYRVRQAPLPLTLVMAPNGAIVRAFTRTVDEKALAGAFASPKVAEMFKALQERRLVTLCLQGAATKHNGESRRAAQQLVGDPKLKGQAVLITADPRKEADLLKRCRITSPPLESTVLMIVPPGRLVATVAGATTKAALLAKLTAALSSCGPGCSPGGCAP